MPTILDLCHISVNDCHQFHGESIVDLLYEGGNTTKNRVIVTDSQRVPYPVKWKNSSVMTNQWRLINGQELYDINVDREQKNDVASQYSKVVDDLTQEYDKWWHLVSGKFNEDIPIFIGQKPIAINCHDIRNEDSDVPFNQRLIRQGKYVTGYWEIEIEESGFYEFELRRWPASTNYAISKGIEGSDIMFNKEHISKEQWDFYRGGKAISINKAYIKIQEQVHTCAITEDDTVVNFIITLKKGKAILEAWFSKKEQRITSAYYVYVTKIL